MEVLKDGVKLFEQLCFCRRSFLIFVEPCNLHQSSYITVWWHSNISPVISITFTVRGEQNYHCRL